MNKYLACPENKLAAAWQNHTVSALRSFSAPFRRGSLSKRVFETFGCTTQPSWQDHTTRRRDSIFGANTPTGEYICFSEEPQEKLPSTLGMMPLEEARVAIGRAGSFQPAMSDGRQLHQETVSEPVLVDQAGGRDPLFCNNLFSGDV